MEIFSDKRFIVKLGSSSVVDKFDNLRVDLLDSVAAQTSLLIDQGCEIAIVTSGAVACGRSRLSISDGSLVTKQEMAAIGSTKLFSAWGKAFENHGKVTADHLLSERDVQAISEGSPKWPLQRELRDRRVVPVINANDSVNTFELEQLAISADNDGLSAFIADLVEAGGLIMLTEADGVWDKDKRIIDLIRSEEDLRRVYVEAKSSQGTGGIESKIAVASSFARDGRSAWIAGGHIGDVLVKIAKGEQVGTRIKMD